MPQILIVDDDAATRDLLRRALETDGHTVSTAADGGEALELLKGAAAGVDLLITDVQMPGVDGIKLAGEALMLYPRLHILMMSGYSEELDRAAALGAGNVHTLSKPFSLDKARAEVKKALG